MNNCVVFNKLFSHFACDKPRAVTGRSRHGLGSRTSDLGPRTSDPAPRVSGLGPRASGSLASGARVSGHEHGQLLILPLGTPKCPTHERFSRCMVHSPLTVKHQVYSPNWENILITVTHLSRYSRCSQAYGPPAWLSHRIVKNHFQSCNTEFGLNSS